VVPSRLPGPYSSKNLSGWGAMIKLVAFIALFPGPVDSVAALLRHKRPCTAEMTGPAEMDCVPLASVQPNANMNQGTAGSSDGDASADSSNESSNDSSGDSSGDGSSGDGSSGDSSGKVSGKAGAAEKKPKACEPTCHWTCSNPHCEQTCQPLCASPVCKTYCKPLHGSIVSNGCHTRCNPPKCTVICPRSCTAGNCPKCRTVCGPPVCETMCNTDCMTKCADPICNFHCEKPTNCAKPVCSMSCQSASDCLTGKPGVDRVLTPKGFAPMSDAAVAGFAHGVGDITQPPNFGNTTDPEMPQPPSAVATVLGSREVIEQPPPQPFMG